MSAPSMLLPRRPRPPSGTPRGPILSPAARSPGPRPRRQPPEEEERTTRVPPINPYR
jgi:hypothetical protein